MATDALGRNTLVLTFIADGAIAANHFVLPEAVDGTSAIGITWRSAAFFAMHFRVSRDKIVDGQVSLTSANLHRRPSGDTGGTARKATTTDVQAGVALTNTNSGAYAEIHLGNAGIF